VVAGVVPGAICEEEEVVEVADIATGRNATNATDWVILLGIARKPKIAAIDAMAQDISLRTVNKARCLATTVAKPATSPVSARNRIRVAIVVANRAISVGIAQRSRATAKVRIRTGRRVDTVRNPPCHLFTPPPYKDPSANIFPLVSTHST